MQVKSLVRRLWDALRFARASTSTSASELAVDQLDASVLASPCKTRVGYGRGCDACSACHELILAGHTQYELEDDTGGVRFQFHVICYRLRDVARRAGSFSTIDLSAPREVRGKTRTGAG